MAAAQRPPVLGSLALIAIVIGLSAALFRLHGRMVFAAASHAGQGGRGVFASERLCGAWPPPQPCQGDLLYRRL